MNATPHVYNGVTPEIFDCVKTTSYKEHGTVYAPPGANSGTATTTSPGKVVLTFDFSPLPMEETLSYTLVEKPWWIPESAIWDGIANTINGCRGSIVAARKAKSSS